MQKLLLATAVAASVSLASFAAVAANGSDGAFVHLGAGKARHNSHIEIVDGKTPDQRRPNSYDIMAGYRWGLGSNLALGAEGGFAYLGSIRQRVYDDASPAGTRNSLFTGAWLAGLNTRWNMSDDLSLIGRTGIARVRSRLATENLATSASATLGTVSRNTPYFGVGLGYALTRELDLTVQATRYDARSVRAQYKNGGVRDWSANTFNAGVEYRF
ncbi:outer membrane protein [Luteibacter yeojuensis]|uniref:Porin family protein n=1 Tax=Luteibacter yeojuensis TaxID=345309 RepID=A0A7X5QXT5_9GAMM|nr:outer membrane beta-barrel protein [Luteibacter yeojuensis]NID17339.1 porin family protein [Luteibacter yeojuensis]